MVVSIGGDGEGWGRCSRSPLEHSRIQEQVLHQRGTVPAHRDTHQTEQHSLVARKTKVTLQETHVHKASEIPTLLLVTTFTSSASRLFAWNLDPCDLQRTLGLGAGLDVQSIRRKTSIALAALSFPGSHDYETASEKKNEPR